LCTRAHTRSKLRPECYGPQRFFYDRSSYTGTHANNGPDRVPKKVPCSTTCRW
jgi:hypothetical protein